MIADQAPQSNVHFRNQHPGKNNSRAELLEGLLQTNKSISPKYFYDARGSQLFEQITHLPEYYPTRTEKHILSSNAAQMHKACGNGCVLIEPGSGSSEKVRLLLEDLRPSAYLALDISADFLRQATEQLGNDYPALNILAICTDFGQNWSVPADLPPGRRIVFYPGSTLGNLEPQAAQSFLAEMRAWINDSGGGLIGLDMHKNSARLNAAYNDSQGITAAFNRNILSHVNTVLGANFIPENYRHYAFYNEQKQRIEMHLVAQGAQRVDLGGPVIELADGETIHTENSYKYTVEQFSAMCRAAGLQVQQRWSDSEDLFNVFYVTP